MKKMTAIVGFTALMLCILTGLAHGDTLSHPRPSGYAEEGTAGAAAALAFGAVREDAKSGKLSDADRRAAAAGAAERGC